MRDAAANAVEETARAAASASGADDDESETASTAAKAAVLRTGETIRAILGLVVLLVLAYLGGHPTVQRFERRLQISHVVTAGFPFVVLGLIARQPSVGILSDLVLHEIRPLLPLGLGWIGFAVGFRFEARAIDSLPRGAASIVALTTAVPFGAIVAACGLVLLASYGTLAGGSFLRDALILGAAGAMTARTVPHLLEARGVEKETVDRVSRIVQLEEIAAVVGLMLVAAYFRPVSSSVGWHLPGTAWLFITLGMGATMGGLVFVTLRRVSHGPEFTVVTLGSVCFAAGMASFVRLSPVVVCFIAGVILVNFAGAWVEQVRQALRRLERPIYLMFLVIAGASWNVGAWQGWVLMALFVIARLAGKWVGMLLVRRSGEGDLSRAEERSLMVAPIGALSIAIVVSAQDLYFGPTISWLVTAVIGGAIVNEVVVQVLTRGRTAASERPPPLEGA